MEIDEIDRQILQVLDEDPRKKVKEISKVVGLTPQAVGLRIKRLLKDGVIGGIKILAPFPQPLKPTKKVERFKTNISGFDNYIGGGFPNPSTILLSGESGAGTTVFCLKLLWTALNEGLRCAYFSIERPSAHVKQQMKSFGWDPSQSEDIKFIDVYDEINKHTREFETISHLDVLQIYRIMIEKQKRFMPDVDILFFDNLTELIKLAKGTPIEIELVNQLGTNIMKHKRDRIYFYVIKPHFITRDALLTLKSCSDCVIQFRHEIKNQQIQRYMLIEKMLYTEHILSEIQFHINHNGIILNDYMLQHKANLDPVASKNVALFQIKELDYLTHGLGYGTTWLFEIDSLFPFSDLIKLYTLFFSDGLEREKNCRFAVPNFSLSALTRIFTQTIVSSKILRKRETELIDLIFSGQLALYDFFQRTQIPEVGLDPKYFEPAIWSHNPEKNLAKLGTLFTTPKEKNTYFGIILSDLMDIRLKEKEITWFYEYLLKMNQKAGHVLLATINPALHTSKFINKLEYISDGIIKLWVDSEGIYEQEKYLQITKTPQGKPSVPHHLIVNEIPPYFQVI